ncbi:MAG: hypothetical protein MUF28_03530 [Ignavibacterium sp.]|nr:hypothetical protein [Ignavibacterium sp.]
MVDKERIFKITNERKIFFGIFISMFVLTEYIDRISMQTIFSISGLPILSETLLELSQ